MSKIYTHFRYIAYQVPTLTEDNNKLPVYGIPSPKLDSSIILKGNTADLNNLNDDSETRIRRFLGVLYLALLGIKDHDNDTTLKIFMAPEFYFRPAKDSLSYTYKQYKAIKNVLRATIRADIRFENWLIIPGTILWVGEGSETRVKLKGKSGEIYFNSTIYIYGPTSHVNEKLEASTIDGMPTGRHNKGKSLLPLSIPNRFTTDEAWDYYKSNEKRKKHLFMIANVYIGIDICLEHKLQVVRKAVLDQTSKAPVGPDDSFIHLHLLISGGMSVGEQNVSAVKGGYILKNDGYPYGMDNYVGAQKCDGYSSYIEPSLGKKVRIKQVDDQKPIGLSSLADLTPLKQNSFVAFTKKDALYLPSPKGCEVKWELHPQRIVTYSTQLLAPSPKRTP